MQPSPVVLDSQLLLLLIVGSANRAYIAKHRRLQDYSEQDFLFLLDLIASAPEIVVTPNTLTETSNLARQIAEPARSRIGELFRVVARSAAERYRESSRAVDRVEFFRLGLTDAVLLDLLGKSEILLTADHELYLTALSQGLKASYFVH